VVVRPILFAYNLLGVQANILEPFAFLDFILNLFMNSGIVAHEIKDGGIFGRPGSLLEFNFLEQILLEVLVKGSLFLDLFKVGHFEVLVRLVPLVCLSGYLCGRVKGLQHANQLLVPNVLLGARKVNRCWGRLELVSQSIRGGHPCAELVYIGSNGSSLPHIGRPKGGEKIQPFYVSFVASDVGYRGTAWYVRYGTKDLRQLITSQPPTGSKPGP
jgi:hypothetical protein